MPIMLSTLLGLGAWAGLSTNKLDWPVHVFLIIASGICIGLALIPSSIIAILVGSSYSWLGLPMLVLSYIIATIIGYFIAKKLDNSTVNLLISKFPKAQQLISSISKNSFAVVFLARLSPAPPFAVGTVIFTYLGISLGTLLGAGVLGMLPRTIGFFVLGKNINQLPILWQKLPPNAMLAIIVLVATAVLFYVFRKYSKTISKLFTKKTVR
jgi:uncharacterized membrane protein YdjX (TVP38/TMEM64 family)